MSIQDIINGVIDRERGYVDHPNDKGGPTNWGITEAVARANGWTGTMRDLPRTFAENVYLRRYVTEPKFNLIAAVNMAVAEEMVDTGVNMGPSLPGPWLQRCLNAFNGQQSYYADIVVDGSIGPATVGALRAYLAKRGDEGVVVLLRALNSLQGSRYLDITESRPANEDFVYGWFLQRVGIK